MTTKARGYSGRWHPKIAKAALARGWSDSEIADLLEVSVDRMNQWRADHAEFNEVFRRRFRLMAEYAASLDGPGTQSDANRKKTRIRKQP